MDELNETIESLKKENEILKKLNKNVKSLFEELDLRVMTVQFLELHLKELESYVRILKKTIKEKRKNTPKIRLTIKNDKYVYINYYDPIEKRSKSEYIGKSDDKETILKIKMLKRKYPEIKDFKIEKNK